MEYGIDIIKDFKRFLDTKELSEGSIVTYIRNVKLFEKFMIEHYGFSFAETGFEKLKGYMVSNWASSIADFKVTTRYLYIVSIKIFLKFLYNLQYVNFDMSNALPPAPDIAKYKRIHGEPESEKRAYTKEEIERLLSAINRNKFNGARDYAIIITLMTTGLRVSELAALNIGDVFHDDGFAKVPRKGSHGIPQKIAIPKQILPVIEDYLRMRKNVDRYSSDSPLFVSNRGNRMDRHRIYCTISEYEKAVGIPTGVHTFRHTAITNITKNADPAVARDVAGQKSIVITNRYIHSTDDELIDAVNKLAEQLFD